MTDEEAEKMRLALCEHYRDQVLTAHEFCEALRTWSEVGHAFITQMTGYGSREQPFDGARFFLAASKSSLLGRLLYGREKLRTTPCPECKGIWSGCGLSCPCRGCGWLPNEGEAAPR